MLINFYVVFLLFEIISSKEARNVRKENALTIYLNRNATFMWKFPAGMTILGGTFIWYKSVPNNVPNIMGRACDI